MFVIKQGDTKEPLKVELFDTESGATDITGATVRFRMGDYKNVLIDAPADIQDAANGIVWYVFNAGETDIPGLYKGEFVVEYPDFRQETFPNSGYIEIKILKGLRSE